jgi:hypothetical protein
MTSNRANGGRSVPTVWVVNHGNAFGYYFRDPEDNEIEVNRHTGKYWAQPYGDPIG